METKPGAVNATWMFSEIFDEVVVFIRLLISIVCTLEKDSSQELREDFIRRVIITFLLHIFIARILLFQGSPMTIN